MCLTGLEAAILETQKVLRGAVERQASNANGSEALSSLSSEGEARIADAARTKLEELVSKG